MVDAGGHVGRKRISGSNFCSSSEIERSSIVVPVIASLVLM